MMKKSFKTLKIAGILIIVLFISLSFSFFKLPYTNVMAGPSNALSGWAWSSNIGWISFNCTNLGTCGTVNYRVSVDPVNGNMSGFAWSSNVGWLSFNETAGCPEPGCVTQPMVHPTTGVVSGWARFLSHGGGWNGWVKLGGPWSPSVSFSGATASGFSWGSDVVGWVSWNGVTRPPTSTLSASPATIDIGQSSTLTWTSTNATSCTGTGFSTDNATSGSRSTGALNTAGTRHYQVTCTGAGVSATSHASVTVLNPTASISANPTRVIAGSPSTITWEASQVTSCQVSGPGLSSTATSGTQAVPIHTQSVFTIICQTNGAPLTRSVIVNVVSAFREF